MVSFLIKMAAHKLFQKTQRFVNRRVSKRISMVSENKKLKERLKSHLSDTFNRPEKNFSDNSPQLVTNKNIHTILIKLVTGHISETEDDKFSNIFIFRPVST